MFTAWTRPGIATDADLAALTDRVSTRIRICAPTSHQSCCDTAGLEIFAVDPNDPTLPDDIRFALRQLAPGSAVADRSLHGLDGGWLAVPGVEVKVSTLADLGGGATIAITFADVAELLLAPRRSGLAALTEVVTTERPGRTNIPTGWFRARPTTGRIPLRAPHDHGERP
jgi:hypothetical protein